MTYQVEKAKITLQCDGPKGGCGYCNARTTFSERSVSACLREARDAGWKLKNTDDMLTNSFEGRTQLLCRCPDCAERSN